MCRAFLGEMKVAPKGFGAGSGFSSCDARSVDHTLMDDVRFEAGDSHRLCDLGQQARQVLDRDRVEFLRYVTLDHELVIPPANRGVEILLPERILESNLSRNKIPLKSPPVNHFTCHSHGTQDYLVYLQPYVIPAPAGI